MNSFIINATSLTPEILYSESLDQLAICGRLLSVDSEEFWQDLSKTLDQILSNHKSLQLNLKIDYINTISVRHLYRLLKKFEERNQQDQNIKIRWYYNSVDEDNLDLGQILKNTTTIPFDLISAA
jgi:hypothetical protein